MAAAKHCHLLLTLFREPFPAHNDVPGGGRIKSAQHMEQRRLAGAGGADNRHELPGIYREAYPIEGLCDMISLPIILSQINCLQNWGFCHH